MAPALVDRSWSTMEPDDESSSFLAPRGDGSLEATVDDYARDGSPDVFFEEAQRSLSDRSVPETPTGKQQHRPAPVRQQMCPSAEKYNRNNKIVRQRSPPVPEADLDTSKLAVAFPGFSGIGEDVKPISPKPSLDVGPGQPSDRKSKRKEAERRPYFSRPLRHQVEAYLARERLARGENDVSVVSETSRSPVNETRPPPINLNNRSTRFGSIHNPKIRQGPQPHMYNSPPGLVQTDAQAASANVSKPLAVNAHGSLTSMPNGSTQSTLNLPQASNLSELFSGVVRPCPEPRPGRPLATRFTSASLSKVAEAAEAKAKEVEVPANERHLLRTIDYLSDRVAELEQRELEERQRRDSAVDSAANGNEDGNDSGASRERLASENKRLVSTYWALTGQRDALLRDLQTAQASLKNLEQQRDDHKARLMTAESDIARIRSQKDAIGQKHAQAVAQLAVANSNNDVLTHDRDVLLDENEQLRAHIAHLTRARPETADATPENSRLEHADADDEGPLHMDSGLRVDEQRKQQPNQQVNEQQKSAYGKSPSPESSHNITYVSYAGASGSAPIRKDLEHERKARHQPQKAEASKPPVVDSVSERKANANVNYNKHIRQSSDSSVSTTRITRRSSLEGRTSSLIMNDITFSLQPAAENQSAAPVSAAAPVTAADTLPPLEMAPLDPSAPVHPTGSLPPLELIPLDAVQHQTQRSNIPQKQPQQAREPAKLPTISDEELDITINDDEPTERPSQPPAAALAAVLESVQAERASQQVQLAQYQSNYNRQDVGINRRQRKQLHAKIIALTESIDRKADQVYNLYDLVVCQEREVQSMTRDQVDNTLQSLGLASPWEGIASSTVTSGRRSSRSL